jgi:triacylglycerol lipase
MTASFRLCVLEETTRSMMRAAAGFVAIVVSVGCAEELVAPTRAEEYVPRAPEVIDDVGDVGVVDAEPLVLLGPPYPIILVHGFSGFSEAGPVAYFFEVKEHLESLGADVTAPALPPFNASEERAEVLARVVDEVLARTGKAKVHIIAHSQGGIDTRILLGKMGYGPFVASATTISTPHRGTAVADLALNAPDGVLNPAGQFLAWLFGAVEGAPPDEQAWADDESSDAYSPEMVTAMEALTPARAQALLSSAPIPPSVPFFTLAGVTNLRSLDNVQCAASLWERADAVDDTDPFLVPTGTYLSFTDGGSIDEPTPNDGLVTVASARAPEGTFLGCFPADHADEIGQFGDFGPGFISGWDHRDLYARILAQVRSVE